MRTVEAFAPAKINLTLHVTGQREGGFHTLDSLVMFADVGDKITLTISDKPGISVTGPMAAGVPQDHTNLSLRAADFMGATVFVELEKHLPNAAGIGGGSSDAAATLRAISNLTGTPIPKNCITLGADIPLCLHGTAARMRGIGDIIEPLPGLPALHAVLINPNLAVPTPGVFRQLTHRRNTPMPAQLPTLETPAALIDFLQEMRNDLEAPAIKTEPVIAQVFEALQVTPGCRLARMSGSGGTCFGLYEDAETAGAAVGRLQETYPGWWVMQTQLNAA